MKLISMTDFVLEQSKRIMNVEITHLESHNQIVDYANFLKQPLKLEMFICSVPEPEIQGGYSEDGNFVGGYDEKWIEEYYEAKEKVLFEGFEVYKHTKGCIIKDNKIIFEWLVNRFSHTGTTIESLTLSHDDFNLTPNAINQLGL